MGFLEKGMSAIGRLIVVATLLATFLVGMLGVVYLQLKGDEVEIPKVVGKNINEGKDELARYGLRVRTIASRYSEEEPNTILEQRPRAGTTGKTGLMISVVVSQENPDGTEAPADVKDDEEVIEEIEDLPELKTEKPKKKRRSKPKKTSSKTRDVIVEKPKVEKSKDAKQDTPSASDTTKATKSGDKKPAGDKPVAKPPVSPSQNNKPKTPAKKTNPPKAKPKKTNGETRPRKTKKGN